MIEKRALVAMRNPSDQGPRDQAQLTKNLSYAKGKKEEKEAQPEKSVENAEEEAASP